MPESRSRNMSGAAMMLRRPSATALFEPMSSPSSLPVTTSGARLVPISWITVREYFSGSASS